MTEYIVAIKGMRIATVDSFEEAKVEYTKALENFKKFYPKKDFAIWSLNGTALKKLPKNF